MFFYEVAPASRTYHGSTLLTYSSEDQLHRGQIIVVKIRNKPAVAFVVHQVTKPEFKTTQVSEMLPTTLPEQDVALFEWLLDYYPAPLGLVAQLFLPLAAAKDYRFEPTTHTITSAETPPKLTKEQAAAVRTIQTMTHRTALLHGDTGTGKTRVYIELALEALAAGKSALILVPEISLSPQTVKTFQTYIGSAVQVTHSNLTPAQRRKTWQAIASNPEPQVVIGPRSALFTPLQNVGLVVIDEFHEGAYKQDQAPYYQTVRVASRFAALHDAKLILGSATPLVGEYYVAEAKGLPIIRMQEKAAAGQTVDGSKLHTQLVNLKDDDQKTRYPLISATLLQYITRALSRGEQTLLFLNKRGSARIILCQNCGWHALCPNCDLPLTYHGDQHRMQCHTCGFNQQAPTSCPQCKSTDIIFKSPGTKAIVEAIQKHFPDARIARFDKDNLKAERLEARHEEVVSGEIDILVGTQLLAKGHDLPRLSLVGILLAENELQFPDYTSSERSYQLMHQLIGRVGRGHRAGEVVVQTYDPDNLAVRTAIRSQTWQDFYDAQIAERKAFDFPPFAYLMKIEISRAKLDTVYGTADQIIAFLHASGEKISIAGPAPSFIEKRNNTYNWQIIVKSRQRSALIRLAKTIPIKCTINLDPSNLL